MKGKSNNSNKISHNDKKYTHKLGRSIKNIVIEGDIKMFGYATSKGALELTTY